MKKSVNMLISVLAVVCMQQTVIAQDLKEWKWWNPAAEGLPVIEGRGWQTDLANPYDRLPAKAEEMVRPHVWRLSQNSAGQYLNFKTSAHTIIVRYQVKGSLAMPHMPATGVSGVDLYARDINGDWQWARPAYTFGDTVEYRFNNLALSGREEEFRLYLPLYNSVSWMNIGVPESKTFTPLALSNEKPIVLYGTSIMQGGCASRPGLAWTNILGRQLDRHIINLGFSGNGQLEEPVINLMNEMDARLYVLDCMPNLTTFSKDEIRHRIVSSVKNLQARHPAVPILLAEHSGGLPGSNMDTSMVRKHNRVSNIVSETFVEMQKEGIKNIYLLTDETIHFDDDDTVDGTHPNDIGMMKYADAYEKVIRQILKTEKGTTSTTVPARQRRDYNTYDFIQRHEAVLKTVREAQPEVVLIGNSITHFWGGVPEAGINTGAASWKKYLAHRKTVNLGFGWDRIENVLWRVYHGELDGFKAKKIVVMIGTNNLSIGNTDAEIIEGLEFLMKAIKLRQPTATILLSGIFPRRKMEDRIGVLNKRVEGLAKSMSVQFINPGSILLKHDKEINEALFSDGLHPNSKGYELLGTELDRHLGGG